MDLCVQIDGYEDGSVCVFTHGGWVGGGLHGGWVYPCVFVWLVGVSVLAWWVDVPLCFCTVGGCACVFLCGRWMCLCVFAW